MFKTFHLLGNMFLIYKLNTTVYNQKYDPLVLPLVAIASLMRPAVIVNVNVKNVTHASYKVSIKS